MRVAVFLFVPALLLVACKKPSCEATDLLRAEIDGVRYDVPVSLQPLQSAYPADTRAPVEWGYEAGRGRYLYCQAPRATPAILDALMFDAQGARPLPPGVLKLSLGHRRTVRAGGRPGAPEAPALFDKPVTVRCSVGSETYCRFSGTTPEGLVLQFDVDTTATPRDRWPALFREVERFERSLRAAG